jgi:hypothetical protein
MPSLSRPWLSSIENAVIRPRHKFGIDGRLLLCPILVPFALFGLCSRMPIQLYWYGAAFVGWLVAQVLWEFSPWLIDDLLAERRLPKWFVDVPHGR